jgi:hypothetical protein
MNANKGTTGRDWDEIVERVDLEMTDADLAAAERKLRALPGDEVVQIRPEWLAATVATATTPIAEETEARPRFALLRRAAARVQAAAAAVLALVGIHSATAATVTAVTVGTVTTVALVSALWPEGRMSHETMSYEQAVAILMDATEPEEARTAAIIKALGLVGSTLTVLGNVETDSSAGAMLAVEATARRSELLDVLRSDNPRFHSWRAGTDFDAALAGASNAVGDDASRTASLRAATDDALAAASALRSMPALSSDLATARDRAVKGLLRRFGN